LNGATPVPVEVLRVGAHASVFDERTSISSVPYEDLRVAPAHRDRLSIPGSSSTAKPADQLF
jgi:hypothetical protein